MTPYEYSLRLDEILRYVGRLLISPTGSVEWEVGRTFALISDQERLRYLQSLLANSPEGSRLWEIGWDLRAIVLGWPEAQAVA
ncbi:hypothetical protein [Nocardia sp. NPDC004260]